jgi:carbamoyltransferase
LLIDQKSVAIFDGAPEAGPRALGHRSILFDPRNKNAKDIVNKIKKREWYRPFAGIILESQFNEYFDTCGLKESKFMTINFEAKSGVRDYVPGIIHVDNTCRIQTVSSGFLFNLLTLFYNKTGCPMLLNTSFNLAGEALVQTKKDALDTLNNCSLDAVYFVDDNKLKINNAS